MGGLNIRHSFEMLWDRKYFPFDKDNNTGQINWTFEACMLMAIKFLN
jgi:hypothetical protein